MHHGESGQPARDTDQQLDRSRGEKENDAARDYHENMAKLSRIMDQRKESIEQAHRDDSISAI